MTVDAHAKRYEFARELQELINATLPLPEGIPPEALLKRSRVTELHQTMKRYFGGMSPLVPVAIVVLVGGIAAVGKSIGANAFGTFLVSGWLLLVGYSAVATLRRPSTIGGVARLVVLPGSVGLLLATLIGYTGLTVGGLGTAWSTSSLFLGALVTAGAFAFTRMLLEPHNTTS